MILYFILRLKNSISALEGECGVFFACLWGFFSFLKKLNGTFKLQ